jgi:hypothetical protein
MDQHAAFDAALITSMSEKKSEVRVLAWCSFIIAAVLLESRSTDYGVSAVRLLSVSHRATFRFGMNRGRWDRPAN